jgi:glycosyltransferase involved in cell wall biosynthesis
MSAAPACRVSVVIPTRGRKPSLLRALASLRTQSLPPGEYEVIVSVDGSEDGTADAARALETPYALSVLERPARGRAAACNAGIEAASGEVIVLLDDDMEASPGLLAAHLAAHRAAGMRAVVGAAPILVTPGADPFVRYTAAGFERRLERLGSPHHRVTFRDTYTGNFSCRRDVLRTAGGFDEAFAVYGHEDYELALRLENAGVELAYDATALAHQHYEKSFEEFARDGVSRGRTAVLFADRHPEITGQLRLGEFYAVDWKWRVLRGALLALDRVTDRVPGWVVAAVRGRERRQPARMDKAYRLGIDYLFWHGAFRARRDRVRGTAGRWHLIRGRIAVGLVLVYGAVTTAQWLDEAAAWPGPNARDEISANDARFAPLRGALPPSGRVGYLGDPVVGGDTPRERDDSALQHFRRYLLAQYALAPVVLVENTDPEVVVGNFDAGAVRPPPDGFELEGEFGDGLVLYRYRGADR